MKQKKKISDSNILAIGKNEIRKCGSEESYGILLDRQSRKFSLRDNISDAYREGPAKQETEYLGTPE